MNHILTVNAGSSSIKFALFNEALDKVFSGLMERLNQSGEITIKHADGSVALKSAIPMLSGKTGHESAFAFFLEWLDAQSIALSVVGHRVVHGGTLYTQSVVIDETVLRNIESLSHLAPLHQPNNIAGIKAIHAFDPSLKQVACFDTAFHTTISPLFQHFALPEKYFDEGVRRYGFHGLSYEYIAGVLSEHLPEAVANGRVIVAHLGFGASLCALNNKQSFNTTMGFTALEGLPMGSRTGTIDPGVLLYFMQEGMDVKTLETLLYHDGGLKGMSGISGDTRDLLASDSPLAQQALDYFAYQTARQIMALATDMGGIDALIFTAGIGENSPEIRGMILERLGTFAPSHVAVIPTNEEWMMAKHAQVHNQNTVR